MLLHIPWLYKSEDDDSAPVDYSFTASVAEGERRRQSEPIHRGRERATAGPTAPPVEPRGYETAARDPRDEVPQSSAHIAYPRPRDNAFARTPTYAPRAPGDLPYPVRNERRTGAEYPEATRTPRPQEHSNRRSARYAAPRPTEPAEPVTKPPVQQPSALPLKTFTYNGDRYAAPPTQPVPDWLTAARQNKVPYDHNRRPPRVQPAPLQREPASRPRTPQSLAEQYAAAGYPPELIADQRSREETDPTLYNHIRHGAQHAQPVRQQMSRTANPPQRPVFNRPPTPPPGGEPGPGPRDPFTAGPPREAAPYTVVTEKADGSVCRDEDTEPEEENRKPGIPFLGIAVSLAAILLVALWILQMGFADQTKRVYAARAEAVQSQIERHPYSYRELIEAQAETNNLHPAFVAAIVLNESSFNPDAESRVGARGLMQMMEDTAEWVHGKMDADTEYSFDLMYDPATNVRYACWYLAYLSDHFYNDPVLVAAAFHAGQTTVRNWLNNSNYSLDHRSILLANMEDGPTKNYATRVLNAYAVYRRLYYEGGLTAADALETVAAQGA